MKHNLLKSVILSVILFMGVSNAWGKVTIYLSAHAAENKSDYPNSWEKDNAKFSIYYYNQSTNEKGWSNIMTKIKDDYYQTTIDNDNFTHYIAVRHGEDFDKETWSNKWNQTNDIELDKGNHVKIRGLHKDGWKNEHFDLTSAGFTSENQATIYFDNTYTDWDQVFLRVGTGAMDENANGYNQAYKLEKIQGTNLYTGTFPIWRGYTTFNFANNCGWTNDNNIYQPYSVYNDIYQITAQTHYAIYPAENNQIYISKGEETFDQKGQCTDYPFSSRNVYCTVKLHPVSDSRGKDYGQFTIKYNETTYESDADKDVTINNIFYGSTITIVESHHNYPKIFNGDLALKKGGGGWSIIENPINYSITVDNDIEIDERFVVRKEAVINKNLHLFLKIPKDLDKNNGSDIGWHNNDGTDGSETNGYSTAKEDCANFVWLGEGKYEKEILGSVYDPNNNIDERGCGSAGQKEGSYLMRPLSIEDNDHNYYYCTVTDSCWLNVKFERKHADSDPGNSPLMDAGVHRFPGDGRVCFRIEKKDGGGFTGVWEEAPKYTVQLGYSEFGEYKVMCNGNIYTSKPPKQNVSFEAPYGSEITFVEGTPLQDIYKGGWMLREPNKTHLDATQPYIVKGNITFDDNFVTRNEHVFYLAVPDNLDAWTVDKAEYYIYTYDDVTSFPMYEETCHGTEVESYNGNGYKYYKFTLPAERSAFRFQHKVPSTGTTNSNKTWAETDRLQFQVPTTEKNCYYLTGEKDNDYYKGYWDILPIDDDQYRLLYVEQVVEKDDENNTILTRKKAHPSDIFTIGDITSEGKKLSLHVYRDRSYEGIAIYDEEGPKYDKKHKYYTTKASNAGVILQKTFGGKWVDISNNMVFGPLEAVPEVALLPGRKNAASNNSTDYDYLYYDDGIENIKKDEHEDEGNGVWNFVVKKDNSNNVYIALNETHRYKGEYYIRTVAAEGGWENYKTEDENQMSENQMTRSDISKVHSNYSHYFCKWIGQAGTDVQFTIANDYGCAISDTLVSDRTDLKGNATSESEKIVRGQTLPKEANVRFSWNEKTNFIHRAYLGGSTDVHERFLVLTGSGDNKLFDLNGNQLPEGKDTPANPDPRYGLNTNEEIFNDICNWVYYADVKMIPRAQVKLTADYKWKEDDKDIEVIQYFVGTPTEFCDTTLNTVDGAPECKQQYRMRLLYDFKTNELISAYVPGGNTNIEQIKTNVMLIRQENEQASQFSFVENYMDAVGKRSYGVLELTKASLIDNYQEEDYYRVSLYWISFPFDVAIKDIFGFGTYGTHWLIQSYNGQKRADNGLWKDSDTNWEYHFKPNTLNAGTQDEGIMKKGVGYVVALNRKQIEDDELFNERIKTIALYFPAKNTIQGNINNRNGVSISVPPHKCTINRGTPQGDRRIKDSHWNVIGVPSYTNAVSHFGNIDGSYDHVEPAPQQLQFYYKWLGVYDKYEILDTYSSTENFNSLGAYMVQYAGTLTWSSVLNEESPSLAPKRNSDNAKQYHLRLELQQNGQEQDRTFIHMQKDEVTTGFDFNYDLCKITNKGANIYSLIATDTYPEEVAANVLPIEEAIIPLGVVSATAGEYTFAMPEGTDGIVVELIDYETNTRTNMLLDNYTINLGKGTFDNRFALHVKPDKTTTSIVDVNTNSNGVRKFIIDGTLYMQKDGVLYDAQGRCVQ